MHCDVKKGHRCLPTQPHPVLFHPPAFFLTVKHNVGFSRKLKPDIFSPENWLKMIHSIVSWRST